MAPRVCDTCGGRGSNDQRLLLSTQGTNSHLASLSLTLSMTVQGDSPGEVAGVFRMLNKQASKIRKPGRFIANTESWGLERIMFLECTPHSNSAAISFCRSLTPTLPLHTPYPTANPNLNRGLTSNIWLARMSGCLQMWLSTPEILQ